MKLKMYFGASVGIAVRGNDLEIVCLRGRWNRVKVAAFLRLENFRSLPIAEAARRYQAFRRESHAGTASAVVALPRGAGLIRTLDLPAEVAPQLAQSVSYQADTLHPFGDGAVYYDFSLLPQAAAADAPAARLRVAVALVERKVVDDLYDWLTSAGVDVGGFTFAAAGIYQALSRTASSPTERRAVLVVDRAGETGELLGFAGGAFCSKELPPGASLEREIQLCKGELRLKPGDETALVVTGDGRSEHWSAPTEGPEMKRLEEGMTAVPEIEAVEFRLREHFAVYAAALAALERRMPGTAPAPGLRWNLLPAGKRVHRSHWAHAAAIALGAVVGALAVAWLVVGATQDRLYAGWLDSRARTLRPRIEQLDRLDTRQKALLEKLAVLDRQQNDITRKLDAWQELTRVLAPPGWLTSLQFQDDLVVAQGVAESASGLLQALNQSPRFEQAEFVGAITRNNEGREQFHLRLRLRDMPAPAAPAAAPPAPSAQTSQGAAPAMPAVPPAQGTPGAASPPAQGTKPGGVR